MKMFITFFMFLFFTLCVSANESSCIAVENIDDFYIGKKMTEIELPDYYTQYEHIVVGSFAFPYVRIISNGIIYNVCYDWNSLVRYITIDDSTADNFSTPEGIRIGMSYKEIKKLLKKIKLNKSRTIGYFMKLPSGWYITFWVGNSGIDHYPKGNDKISRIYKV